MDRSYGGSPACRRLRTHQNRQARWGKANHPDISRTSAQHHPDIGEATLQTLLTPPEHLKNQPKWCRTPLMTCVASLGTPHDPSQWTGTMGEAPACRRLRTHLDGQELWGKPGMPTPQDPPRWTGAMGEAPACRRLRTHLNGEELWGKPGMSTPQDSPRWTGTIGEAPACRT